MTQATKILILLLGAILMLAGTPVFGQEATAQNGNNPQAVQPKRLTDEEITRNAWLLAWMLARKNSKSPPAGRINYKLLQGKVKYGNFAQLQPPTAANAPAAPTQ
ncbi:MAG: hypothetical protein VX610_10930 [SAR324 cluster bacterium]|nr:hypothetical protein [SAR324 cluster bacterium]